MDIELISSTLLQFNQITISKQAQNFQVFFSFLLFFCYRESDSTKEEIILFSSLVAINYSLSS